MKKSAVVLLMFLIPGVVFGFGKKSNEDKESYVNSVTDEQIINDSECSKGMTKRNSFNNKTTISISRFNGIDCVATFSPKNQNIELKLSSKVDKGDLRLFLCDSDSIICEFDVGKKDQTYVLPSQNSKCYLKAVGENCNYSVEIELTVKKVEVPSFEGIIL